MKSTEKNQIKWSRVIRPMAMSLVLVFLLSYATFAWMKRDWTPTLTQENVKIIAGSSLTFVYIDPDKDENNYDISTASVNSLLGIKNFAFKSVSNSTGKSDDFFGLRYGTSPDLDAFDYLDVANDVSKDNDVYGNKYTALGLTHGYIEMKFKVSADIDIDKKQGIYLDSSSMISGVDPQNANHTKAANAMRVSVTIHAAEGEADKEYVFAKADTVHNGIMADYRDGVGHVAHGKYKSEQDKYMGAEPITVVALDKLKYNAEDPNALDYAEEYYFFNVNETTGDSDVFLFDLAGKTEREITVRIWLEGTDSDCTDEISDSALNLFLKFTAGPSKDNLTGK